MVDIGHRTGLFTAAAESPATSEQLAARTGLCERYVREWLGAVTTFPASTFTGYDLDEHAIARARAEAAGAGLKNVTFEVLDVARLTVATPFDVAFVFDALHDQVDPGSMLARIHDALVPGGLLFMREPHAADTLAGNLANPMAPVFYSISTLHCLTVSLAHGGAGIGSAFGEQLARGMLTEAGFGPADVHPAPGHPFDAVYVTRTVR
jgi:SAM-dependent methyltransferase